MPEPSQPPRPQFLNHAALRSSSLPAEEVFDSIVTEFCSSNPARTDHLKRVAFCWAHSWVHASIAPDAIVVGELGRVFHRAYMRDHYQRNRQKILERRHQRERRNHYDQ